MEALTGAACQEAFSYERMETLGDTVWFSKHSCFHIVQDYHLENLAPSPTSAWETAVRHVALERY